MATSARKPAQSLRVNPRTRLVKSDGSSRQAACDRVNKNTNEVLTFPKVRRVTIPLSIAEDSERFKYSVGVSSVNVKTLETGKLDDQTDDGVRSSEPFAARKQQRRSAVLRTVYSNRVGYLEHEQSIML